MKREDLIGRSIPEILNPGVFETTIKDKLAECFRGKILQFEMRYRYPNRGERELVVAHFPIKGRHGVDRVASVLRDVTEQKEAEAALRERKIAIAILWNPPKTWSLRMICMASYCQ
jgi:PAS domain S-box-containing protein